MGKFILKIVPDCTKATLQAVILGKVDIQSVIYSEAFVVTTDLLMWAMISILELITAIMNLLMANAISMVLRAFGVLVKDDLLNLMVLLPTLSATTKNVNGVGVRMLMSYNAICGV